VIGSGKIATPLEKKVSFAARGNMTLSRFSFWKKESIVKI
jgi:hypothetical protein